MDSRKELGSFEKATLSHLDSVYPAEIFPPLDLMRVKVGPLDFTFYHHFCFLQPSTLSENKRVTLLAL